MTRLAGLPPDPLLRTAALLTGDPAAFAARLRLSAAEAQRLQALHGPAPAGDDDDAAAGAGRHTGRYPGRAVLAGWPADAACAPACWRWPRPVFPLAGRDVVAAGVPPGPLVGG